MRSFSLKNSNIWFSLLGIAVLSFAFFSPVSAQTLTNPLGSTDIRSLIGRLISAFLGVIGAISLLMFVMGGYTWLISAGRAEYIQKGKDTMIWASLGLLVVFGSYMIVSFLLGVTVGTLGS